MSIRKIELINWKLSVTIISTLVYTARKFSQLLCLFVLKSETYHVIDIVMERNIGNKKLALITPRIIHTSVSMRVLKKFL